MTRSVRRKAGLTGASSSTSLRSARMLLGFQPSNVRSARANQLSPISRSILLGRGTGTGRLRGVLGSLEVGWIGIRHGS